MRRLLTLLAIIPLTTFCQNTDTTKTKKLSIGLAFSPDYCYRLLKPDASNISKLIADKRDTLEIPKLGYTTGLNLSLNINKRITLETGLLFSNKGEKTKTYSPIWITSSGQPDPALPTKITSFYHYIYLDIPIKANYYLLIQRAKLFLTAGISPNFFLTQKTTSIYEYSDGHTSTNTSSGNNGFARLNLAFTAGLGFGYDLTKKVYLKIEPTYRRSITSIIDAPIKGYLYSSGLNVGLYYTL